MKELLEMMDKKEDMMSDEKVQAKKEILQELIAMADGGERDGIMDGLSKITVAAKDQEGLKEGMEKASEMMDDMPEMMDEKYEEMDDEDDEMDY